MSQEQTKPSKYQSLLQQSQEEKDQQDIQYKVEETRQQLQADLLASNRSLATNKRKLQELKSEYPLKTQDIISLEVTIEGQIEGIKRLKALEAELFS